MSGTASSISEGLFDRRYSDRWRYFGYFPCIDTYASYACGYCNVRFWAGTRALFCAALTPLSLLFYLFSVLFHYFRYFTPSLLFSFARLLSAPACFFDADLHTTPLPQFFAIFTLSSACIPQLGGTHALTHQPFLLYSFLSRTAARRIGVPLAHAHPRLSLLFLRPRWFSLLSLL